MSVLTPDDVQKLRNLLAGLRTVGASLAGGIRQAEDTLALAEQLIGRAEALLGMKDEAP